MKNGLLDPVILSFVFAPLAVTVAVSLALWWLWMRDRRAGLDGPGLLLASVVRMMPGAHADWGAAMMAELHAVRGSAVRWRFALGCARAALFSPRVASPLPATGRTPVLGLLSVTLPPLALPFLYVAAVLIEAMGGSPYTQTENWSNPAIVMAVVKLLLMLTIGLLVVGVPLGVVAWLRHERVRWLAGAGVALSVGMLGYFLTGMHFLAGGN